MSSRGVASLRHCVPARGAGDIHKYVIPGVTGGGVNVQDKSTEDT